MKAVSRNEIEALLTKAARGAGTPPAQAAAFGLAGVYVLEKGEGAAVLTEALEEIGNQQLVNNYNLIQLLINQSEGATFTISDPSDLLFLAYLDALPFKVERLSETEARIDRQTLQRTALPARLKVPEQALTVWQTLAAQTYVPETEQSRKGGAGAGLTDND